MLDIDRDILDVYVKEVLVDNPKFIERFNPILKKLYTLRYFLNILYLRKRKPRFIRYSGRNYDRLKSLQRFYNSLGYATEYSQPFLDFEEYLTVYSKDTKIKIMGFDEKMDSENYTILTNVHIPLKFLNKNVTVKQKNI